MSRYLPLLLMLGSAPALSQPTAPASAHLSATAETITYTLGSATAEAPRDALALLSTVEGANQHALSISAILQTGTVGEVEPIPSPADLDSLLAMLAEVHDLVAEQQAEIETQRLEIDALAADLAAAETERDQALAALAALEASVQEHIDAAVAEAVAAAEAEHAAQIATVTAAVAAILDLAD